MKMIFEGCSSQAHLDVNTLDKESSPVRNPTIGGTPDELPDYLGPFIIAFQQSGFQVAGPEPSGSATFLSFRQCATSG